MVSGISIVPVRKAAGDHRDASMTEPHPQEFELEIERDRLRAYLRFKWFAWWIAALSALGIGFGLSSVAKTLDQGLQPWDAMLILVVRAIGIGWGAGLLLAGVLYFAFSRRLADRFADELRVSVEGPYLRIRQHVVVATDRKLHFRAIVDYAAIQDPLMRWFGIHALQMTTAGGGATAMITVPGVKDCLEARDMLSEIDCRRENQA